MNKELIKLIADLVEEDALAMTQDLIKKGTNPMDVLDDARAAMEIVGKRFETGEYFIPVSYDGRGDIKRYLRDC